MKSKNSNSDVRSCSLVWFKQDADINENEVSLMSAKLCNY